MTQNRMKQMADRKRSERSFKEGDNVYLKVRRFQQQLFTGRAPSKLGPKYFGPLRVLAKVGRVAYRLQLIEGVGIHPVFHVSLLKKSIGPHDPISSNLPMFEIDPPKATKPLAVLDKRVTYHDSLPLTQVLVQ